MLLIKGLGDRIRRQREKRGLKQQDIAHALQVSPQAVSKWERGENAPDISLLGPLARLLGVSTDWLLHTWGEQPDVFEATVFTSGVKGAAEKSMHLDPRNFAAWANGVFAAVTSAVLHHDGVPVKYLGDQCLCFFAGEGQQERAVRAALLACEMTAEALEIGLSYGSVYLGAIGHADYERLDIMGEAVNIAFLTMNWASRHSKSGMAVTREVACGLDGKLHLGPEVSAVFPELEQAVYVNELRGLVQDTRRIQWS